MGRLRRRINALERALSTNDSSWARQSISAEALRRMSDEELELLISVIEAGTEARRLGTWTPEQTAAMEAYTAAIEQECRRADGRSAAAFEQAYPEDGI